ncbi:MAG: hypothetical protein M0Z66_16980 [Thermaerobacter sp.]|nr:hypothetical protein [Thermaerobacter sp.]
MFAGTLRALASGGASPLAGFGPAPELLGFPPPGPWVVRPAAVVTITAALRPDGTPSAVTVSLPYATLSGAAPERSGSYTATLGRAHTGSTSSPRGGLLRPRNRSAKALRQKTGAPSQFSFDYGRCGTK